MSTVAVDSRTLHSSAVARGDKLYQLGQIEPALEAYLAAAAAASELVPASICLKLARSYERLGSYAEAYHWALAVVDAGDDFSAWQTGSGLAQRLIMNHQPVVHRSVKVALVGSYTTTQFTQVLQLATARLGIALEIYESPYGQYRQEILDHNSRMYTFAPDFLILAVHEGELVLPTYSASPQEDVDTELQRWTMLWEQIAAHSKTRVVQYNFVTPCESPMGHLGARLPGSRYMMTQTLNSRLGEHAGNTVSIVDCERLSALYGKQRWFDPRYWHLAKQAVALGALPLLARHTAAVISADLGLSRKCLVLDLDNTLWGGVIGEDGLAGIKLGQGIEGEAFIAFQEYLLKLKQKGIILTVCSKNNESDAREPFEKHPDMRIRLDDLALFVVNWESKPDNLRLISKALNIGLDSMVFLDDSPVERAAVRQFVPEVDVIQLPPDPTQYTRTLSQYLLFETSWFTPEDALRTQQYRERAQVMELETGTTSIEDFYRNLQMQAVVEPFNEFHLPRIAQLIGKTNQFNLTTRRHGVPVLQGFMQDSNCVHFFLRLCDRFSDHGLVSLMIAFHRGDGLEIDTWLMSCRVISRTVEATMLEYLCGRARQLDCKFIRGTYIPTTKNLMAKDVFRTFGFDLVQQNGEVSVWQYDLHQKGGIMNQFIKAIISNKACHERT